MTDKNQGEGDKISARHYDKEAERFAKSGKVEDAAEQARLFVERKPIEAERAERDAKRGPQVSIVDELVAKGRTLFERVRLAVRSRRG